MANNNSEISSKDQKRHDAETGIAALKGEPSTTGAYEPLEKLPTLDNIRLMAYKKYCDLTKAIRIKFIPFIEGKSKEAQNYIAIKTENTFVSMKDIIDNGLKVVDNKKSQGKGKD